MKRANTGFVLRKNKTFFPLGLSLSSLLVVIALLGVPVKASTLGALLPATRKVISGRMSVISLNMVNLPSEYQPSVVKAAEIISDFWQSVVPVNLEVGSQRRPLAVLAHSSPGSFFLRNRVQIPIATAEAILKRPLNANRLPDVKIWINEAIGHFHVNPYSKPHADSFDLTTIILHEFYHGVIFSGRAIFQRFDEGHKAQFRGDTPSVFDSMLSIGDCSVAGYAKGSAAGYNSELGAAFTSEKLVIHANGTKIPIYSPLEFLTGSSIYHLDKFEGSSFMCMNPRVPMGVAQRKPCDEILAIQASVIREGYRTAEECRPGSLEKLLDRAAYSPRSPRSSEGGFHFTLRNSSTTAFARVAEAAAAILDDFWDSEIAVNVLLDFDATDFPTGAIAVGYSPAWVDVGDYFYTIAAAEAITGQDKKIYDDSGISGFTAVVKMNPSLKWYVATSGVPNYDEYDFMTILLHETLHGLLFNGAADVAWDPATARFVGSFTVGSNSSKPSIFDRHLTSSQGCAIVGFLDGNYSASSPEVADALTSNDLYFSVDKVDGVGLYAPRAFIPHSSVYHAATKQLLEFNLEQFIMSPEIRPTYYRRNLDKSLDIVRDAIMTEGRLAPQLCEPGTYEQPPAKIVGLEPRTFWIVLGLILGGAVILIVSCCCIYAARSSHRLHALRQHRAT